MHRTLMPTGVMNLVCSRFTFFFLFSFYRAWAETGCAAPQETEILEGGMFQFVDILSTPEPRHHLLVFACLHYSPHVSCFFCELHCSCLKFGPDHLVSLIGRMCNLLVIYEQPPKQLRFPLLFLFIFIIIIVFTFQVNVQQVVQAQRAGSALRGSLSSSCTARPPVNCIYFKLSSKRMLYNPEDSKWI